jgi:hypothetical protein
MGGYAQNLKTTSLTAARLALALGQCRCGGKSMRNMLFVGIATLFTVSTCRADLPVPIFVDTRTHVERAEDIVIARCLNASQFVKNPGSHVYPGSHDVLVSEFEILRVVKGTTKKGKLRVAHWGSVRSSGRYLLISSGGSAGGTSFLASSHELGIVEIPTRFELSTLDGKTTIEQVSAIFQARKNQIDREMRELEVESTLLEKAVDEQPLP